MLADPAQRVTSTRVIPASNATVDSCISVVVVARIELCLDEQERVFQRAKDTRGGCFRLNISLL
jgi:hypothetical protein